MKISVSEIQDYMKCPYRWYCRWVKNRVPREESPALSFGRLLHEVFEVASLESMEKALTTVPKAWYDSAMSTNDLVENRVRLAALEKLGEFHEPLLLWKDEYQGKTLEVEQAFEMPLPGDPSIIMLGRPDRVILADDYVYHRQHKGLASSVNFGTYLDLAKRSMHEHLYAEAITRKYEVEFQTNEFVGYGGTIFNLIRKLKYRTNVTKKNPEGKVKKLSEMFFQHPMSIDLESHLHKHVMFNIRKWATEIAKLREDLNAYPGPKEPKINELQNGGPYGNVPDVYFRVLVGEITLDDDRYFKDREERYAGTQELVNDD